VGIGLVRVATAGLPQVHPPIAPATADSTVVRRLGLAAGPFPGPTLEHACAGAVDDGLDQRVQRTLDDSSDEDLPEWVLGVQRRGRVGLDAGRSALPDLAENHRSKQSTDDRADHSDGSVQDFRGLAGLFVSRHRKASFAWVKLAVNVCRDQFDPDALFDTTSMDSTPSFNLRPAIPGSPKTFWPTTRQRSSEPEACHEGQFREEPRSRNVPSPTIGTSVVGELAVAAVPSLVIELNLLIHHHSRIVADQSATSATRVARIR